MSGNAREHAQNISGNFEIEAEIVDGVAGGIVFVAGADAATAATQVKLEVSAGGTVTASIRVGSVWSTL